jgi:FixJ family two-component response regulator
VVTSRTVTEALGLAMDSEATVFVIDDDPDVRDALARLLRAIGWGVRVYPAANDFLAELPENIDGCILLDVNMPGMTGPELHDRMRATGITLPVIYLTGQSSLSIGVRAMKNGALDFLEKPVDQDVLLPTIEQAIAQHRQDCAMKSRLDEINLRLGSLSPREREVMDHVIAGRLNKQIAADLGIAEKTVKVHRGRAMSKMQVRSVAELVRLCDAVGVGK